MPLSEIDQTQDSIDKRLDLMAGLSQVLCDHCEQGIKSLKSNLRRVR